MKRPDGRHLLNGCLRRSCFKHPAFDITLEVEETHERVRLRDAEIIAGEKSKSSSPGQQVPKVLEHAVHAAFEREADENIGAIRDREMRSDVRQKRIVTASNQVSSRIPFAALFDKVVGQAGDHVANAAARIENVSGVTRNDV